MGQPRFPALPMGYFRKMTLRNTGGNNKVLLTSMVSAVLAAAFPDVAELLLEAAGQTPSLIIDAEIVAIDRQNGNRIRAFQANMKPLPRNLHSPPSHFVLHVQSGDRSARCAVPHPGAVDEGPDGYQ